MKTLTLCAIFATWLHAAEPDYHARRVHLAEKLKGGISVLFAASEPRSMLEAYRQDSDFFYLTGWNEPGAALFIQSAKEAEDKVPARKYREILFLPARNLRNEQFTGVKLDAATPNAAALAHVDEVRPMTELSSMLAQLASEDRGILYRIFSQPDSPAAQALVMWVATTLGSDNRPPLADASSPIAELRAIKDPVEVELLSHAAKVSAIAQQVLAQSCRCRCHRARRRRRLHRIHHEARLRPSVLSAHRRLGRELHRPSLRSRQRHHASGRCRGH